MRFLRIDGRTEGAQLLRSDHGANRRRVGDSEEGEAGSRACLAVAGRGQGKPEGFSPVIPSTASTTMRWRTRVRRRFAGEAGWRGNPIIATPDAARVRRLLTSAFFDRQIVDHLSVTGGLPRGLYRVPQIPIAEDEPTQYDDALFDRYCDMFVVVEMRIVMQCSLHAFP